MLPYRHNYANRLTVVCSCFKPKISQSTQTDNTICSGVNPQPVDLVMKTDLSEKHLKGSPTKIVEKAEKSKVIIPEIFWVNKTDLSLDNSDTSVNDIKLNESKTSISDSETVVCSSESSAKSAALRRKELLQRHVNRRSGVPSTPKNNNNSINGKELLNFPNNVEISTDYDSSSAPITKIATISNNIELSKNMVESDGILKHRNRIESNRNSNGIIESIKDKKNQVIRQSDDKIFLPAGMRNSKFPLENLGKYKKNNSNISPDKSFNKFENFPEITEGSRSNYKKSSQEVLVDDNEDWIDDFDNTNIESLNHNINKDCACSKTCDRWVGCKKWKEAYLNFPGMINNKNTLRFLKETNEKSNEIWKQIDSSALFHGPLIPKPTNINSMFMDGEVNKSVIFDQVPDLARTIWPAIMRRLNVMIVSEKNTNMLLFPPICSLAKEIDSYYSDLEKYEGPLIIILGTEFESCNSIDNFISGILSKSNVNIINASKDKTDDFGKCDILITTPDKFENLLISSKIKLEKLCLFIIKDIDIQLKKHFEMTSKLFNFFDELLQKRPSSKQIQFIGSAQKWTLRIEELCCNLAFSPLICLDNYLEAAIYGKCQFVKKKLNKDHKKFYVGDLCKKNYTDYRIILFCKEENIDMVKDYFDNQGIDSIIIPEYLSDDDTGENERLYISLNAGTLKVLVCSDESFQKLRNIRNIQCIIHFDIPMNVAILKERFYCLLENINPVNAPANEILCTSYFIIDSNSGVEDITIDKLYSHFFSR